jgi:hypothetical protein
VWGEDKFKQLFGEDLGMDGIVILERILAKWGGRMFTGFIRLKIGHVASSCV